MNLQNLRNKMMNLVAFMLVLVVPAIVTDPQRRVEYMEMVVADNDETIHRVIQDPPSGGIQQFKILVERENIPKQSNRKVPALPLSLDFWRTSEQSTTKNNPIIDKRQVNSTSKPVSNTSSDEKYGVKTPSEIVSNQYGTLGKTVVIAVDNLKGRLPAPLQYEPVQVVQESKDTPAKSDVSNRNPIYVEDGYQQPKVSSIYEEVYQQRKPDQYEPSKVFEEVYQNERPSYVDGSFDSKRKPTRQVYEETYEQRPQPQYVELQPSPIRQQNNERPEDHSIYTGFPESYQPLRNPSQSRPLSFDSTRAFPASPCYGIFQYEGREPSEDEWTGEIYVNTDEVLIGMRLDINLDRPAHLLTNWISDVTTSDNVHFTILSLTKRLVPGAAENVKIRVRFDPNKPVPYVLSINLNGRRICPGRNQGTHQLTTTKRPVFENPGDLQTASTKRTTPFYTEPTDFTERPHRTTEYEERPNTQRTTRYTERRTESSQPPRRTTPVYIVRPDPNPNYYQETNKNQVPTQRPTSSTSTMKPTHSTDLTEIPCGKPAVQPRPLITKGQMTARGQWPWHAAIYKNVGIDLSYLCGGSLISTSLVVTAAHCVAKAYNVKPLDPSGLVVYLGKYHLKLWSEGGVQNKQVSSIQVHPLYNNSDYRADLAVLVLSSPVELTDFIRPVCLWDKSKTDIKDIEGKDGTVVGWGYDETMKLTEELMQAQMPVIKHDQCLWSYPEFFPQFTSNLTYCAGFRNGTSVCNGDSGGGMVFPIKVRGEERWFLRGLVSISVSEKNHRICDTKHYVVFTDIAKFIEWLEPFLRSPP